MRIITVRLSDTLLTLRNSVRAFARTPGISFVLVLAIALGVGSNVAVFGFVQGLIEPNLPAQHDERIFSIFTHDKTHPAGSFTQRQFQLLRARSDSFVWIDGVKVAPHKVNFGSGHQTAIVAAVMPDLADALHLPQSGVAISRRVWQREFGDNDATRARVEVDGRKLAIAAASPEHLDGLYRDQVVDIWMPLPPTAFQQDDQTLRDIWVIARVRNGISIDVLQRELGRQFGDAAGIYLAPYSGSSPTMAKGIAQISTMLQFASVAVFLVACCVVASLLLGRALRRMHIMSINVALGATRTNLMMASLSDCIVVSLMGGVLGLSLALATMRILPSLLFPEDAEHLVFAPHISSILMCALSCFAVILICGFLPILATTTNRPWNILKRESGLPPVAIVRFRAFLVVGQITICCVLTIFTVTLFERFHSLIRTSAGRGVGDLLLMSVRARQGMLDDTNYFKTVEKTVKSMPDFSPIAWTTLAPGSLPVWRSFRVQTPTKAVRDLQLDIAGSGIAPGTLEQLTLWGRPFEAQDQTCHVAVVDEKTASTLFGADTVGITIQEPNGSPVKIIGVIKRPPDPASIDSSTPSIYFNDSTTSASTKAQFRAPLAPPSQPIELSTNSVSTGYLRAFGFTLVDGEWLPENEPVGTCRHLGIINQEAADIYFGGKALGAALIDELGNRTEIIGVVDSQALGTFEQRAQPTVYIPTQQEHSSRMMLLIQSSTQDQIREQQKMDRLSARIKSVAGNDPTSPTITPLDARLFESGFAPLRIARLIFATSTLTALLLSVFGLLSIQSDTERQRRRELAVRIALGAQRRHIFLMTIKSVGRLAIAGIAVGSLISGAALRILANDATTTNHPPFQVWLFAPILSMLILALTATVAAFRALLGEPLKVIREDN